MIALLLMIRDITHNKKESKERVMTLVQSDVELFTTTQDPNQHLDEYYKVLKAQVNTIDAHGGNAGYHTVEYKLHLTALLKKDSIDEQTRSDKTIDEKRVKEKAANTSRRRVARISDERRS